MVDGKMIFTKQDKYFMKMALAIAKKAFSVDEVPIGCVIVKDQEIIGKGYNLVEKKQDATCHAEIRALKQAQKKLGNWRLNGCVMFSTLEPCMMCAGAILLSRIDKLIYAAKDIRHGAHTSFINVFEKKHPTHSIKIESGLFEMEAKELLKTFFQKKRVTRLQ